MSVAESPPPAAPVAETAKLHKRALGVPALVFFIVAASGGGIAGLLVGARLKRTKSDVYAGIGEGG